MEKSFLVLSLLVLTLPSQGAEVQNIACGPTVIDDSGIQWVGDYQYIRSGFTGWVQFRSPQALFLSTVRYFRDDKMNCYSIPRLTRGSAIIRVYAIFQYGNYEQNLLPPSFLLKNVPPSFLLKIDNSALTSVKTTMDVVVYNWTRLAMADANTVNVCLAPDGTGRWPFISAIRIVEDVADSSTYSYGGSDSGSNSAGPTLTTLVLSTGVKATVKGKFGGLISLVTLLPGGTIIAAVIIFIICIKKKNKKKVEVQARMDFSVGKGQESDTAHKNIDEVPMMYN